MNIEIIEYGTASLVGIKQDLGPLDTSDDADTMELLYQMLMQYQLLEEVTVTLDDIAKREGLLNERKDLELYFIITPSFILYGIDYNSGFYIPNNWDFYEVDNGFYTRIHVPNAYAINHDKYLEKALEYTKEKKFDVDDSERAVIYKYVPVNTEEDDENIVINYDLIINVPIN